MQLESILFFISMFSAGFKENVSFVLILLVVIKFYGDAWTSWVLSFGPKEPKPLYECRDAWDPKPTNGISGNVGIFTLE